MVSMKKVLLTIFVVLISLVGAFPRLYCDCHNQDVLLITTATLDCCQQDFGADRSAMFHAGDVFCFKSVNTDALSGNAAFTLTDLAWMPMLVNACLEVQPAEKPVGQVVGNTRAPPRHLNRKDCYLELRHLLV